MPRDEPDALTPAALPAELRARLAGPALVVLLERVRANVGRVLDALDGRAERWRAHLKTSKIPAVQAELVRAGLRRFKCATVREARVLMDVLRAEGVEGADLLVAYPLVGPALAELGRVARAHPAQRVAVLCEDAEALDELPAPLGAFFDLNPGMDRTGASPDERVLALAARAGARLRGLHWYDGHLHDGALAARTAAAHAGYARLLELAERLRANGARVEELVTSGTPTLPCALAFAPFRALDGCVHTVSPGTVVYSDLRTREQVPELGLAPAALVFTRVVSRPAPGVVTCDAGSKALAAEAGAPVAEALGRPELRARTPHEEHLPFDVLEGPDPPRGTELLLVPRHVCPTVNLAERAVLVDGDGWRAVDVAARAHDLLLDPA